MWPASAAQEADWPRLAEACGSLGHPLALVKPARRHSARTVCWALLFRVQSLLEPGYRQTGWDSPTSRSQGVLRPCF